MTAFFLDAFLPYKVDNCLEILISKHHSVCFGYFVFWMHTASLLKYPILMFSLLLWLCTSLYCHISLVYPFVLSQASLLSQLLFLFLGPFRYLFCPELFVSFLCPPPFLSQLPLGMYPFFAVLII